MSHKSKIVLDRLRPRTRLIIAILVVAHGGVRSILLAPTLVAFRY